MKKIIVSFLSGLFMLSAVSCSDFLDKEPDDMLTLDMVFNNKKKTNEWLARVYTNVQDALWNDLRNLGALSDDFQPSLELVQFGWGPTISQQQGSWDATTDITNYWEDFYKAIRSGYIFMNNAKALPDQGLSEQDVDFMKHEVRFLIAYYYVYLMQVYGPVPLVTKEYSSDAPVEELMLARTPLDELVGWIDKELLELADYFPEKLKNEAADFGRPTKGACLALRARMWTWMASPLFNGNTYYADVKNKDGVNLFPQSYDESKWVKAAQANKAVIDLAERGIYDLYRVYDSKTGELDPFTSTQNLFLTSGDVNKEIIWARADANKDEMERYFNPRSNGCYGSCSLTQNLVDAFRMRDGKEITDPGSGYTEDGFTEEDIFYPNTEWNYSDPDRTAGLIVPKETFNMWANREPRFYTTIRFHKAYTVGLEGPAEYANGQKDGRPSHDTPACGYHGRKGTDANAKPRSGFWGTYRPAIIFRLAEFYLNYAEALAQTEPGNEDILKYLNLVRERGGIPALPSSLRGNKEVLQKQIEKEYRIEFAMEGKHRYDYIRRWKQGNEVYKTPIYGLNQYGEDNANIGDLESFYTRTEVMKRVFDDKMYLWPIRQSFIDRNKNLVQNKGW